jgi:hypothetical protein
LVEETRAQEKSTDISQAIDIIYHIMMYGVQLAMNEVRTHNFSGDMHWLNNDLQNIHIKLKIE